MDPIHQKLTAYFSEKVFAETQGHNLLDYLPDVAIKKDGQETRTHFLYAAAAYLGELVSNDTFSPPVTLSTEDMQSAYCTVEGLCDEVMSLVCFGPSSFFETSDHASVLAIAEYLDASARYLDLRKPQPVKQKKASKVVTLYPTLEGLSPDFRTQSLRAQETMDKALGGSGYPIINTEEEKMGFHAKVQSLLADEMRKISHDIHDIVEGPRPNAPEARRARVLAFAPKR